MKIKLKGTDQEEHRDEDGHNGLRKCLVVRSTQAQETKDEELGEGRQNGLVARRPTLADYQRRKGKP
jgi:hypothetical protein